MCFRSTEVKTRPGELYEIVKDSQNQKVKMVTENGWNCIHVKSLGKLDPKGRLVLNSGVTHQLYQQIWSEKRAVVTHQTPEGLRCLVHKKWVAPEANNQIILESFFSGDFIARLMVCPEKSKDIPSYNALKRKFVV